VAVTGVFLRAVSQKSTDMTEMPAGRYSMQQVAQKRLSVSARAQGDVSRKSVQLKSPGRHACAVLEVGTVRA
jgi:hypothetical protein